MSDQPEHAQPQVPKPKLAWMDPAQPEVAPPTVAQAEAAQAEVAQAEDAQAEDAQAEAAQAEDAQAEDAQADVAQPRPRRTVTFRSAVSYVDPLEYKEPCSAIFAILSCLKYVCCLHQQPHELTEDEVNAHKTHYLANFIPRVYCFLMPTKIKGISRTGDAMGFCVRFNDQECDAACVKCAECGTCPHQYSCSCPRYDKMNDSWCAHIHLMRMLTQGRFRGEVCLYIKTDTRYTMVRHVRAALLGTSYMNWKTNVPYIFREPVNYLGALSNDSQIKTIHVGIEGDPCNCPPEDKCDKCAACRCQYVCNCLDFAVDKQVCQHVHCAAMVIREESSDEAKAEPKLDQKAEPELDEEAEPKSDHLHSTVTELRDWTVELSVVLEHEMSFYIDLETDIDKVKPPKNIGKAETDTPSSEDASSGFEEKSSVTEDKSSGTEERISSAGERSSGIEEGSCGPEDGSSGAAESHPQESAEKDSYEVYRGRDLHEGNHYTVEVNSDRSCTCKTTSPSNRCRRCNICWHYYKCNCPLNDQIICRHVHAVHRMLKKKETQKKETQGEAELYARFNFRQAAIFRFGPYQPEDSESDEAEQEQQGAGTFPQSAEAGQPSDVAGPSSAVAGSSSAVAGQQSSVAGQHGAVKGPQKPVTGQKAVKSQEKPEAGQPKVAPSPQKPVAGQKTVKSQEKPEAGQPKVAPSPQKPVAGQKTVTSQEKPEAGQSKVAPSPRKSVGGKQKDVTSQQKFVAKNKVAPSPQKPPAVQKKKAETSQRRTSAGQQGASAKQEGASTEQQGPLTGQPRTASK